MAAWQAGQTLEDLVDVDRAVPVVDDHRLIEIDPAADGREVGCHQTSGHDLTWLRGLTATEAIRPHRYNILRRRTQGDEPYPMVIKAMHRAN